MSTPPVCWQGEYTGDRGSGVDFGDPGSRRACATRWAASKSSASTELRGGDELMTEAVVHLFEAGGKRFRPLFTVLSAQIGPRPD